MRSPNSKQRTVLGWQIRWVASLFCLLMFAGGAIPAYATQLDPQPDSNPAVFLATDSHGGLDLPDDSWSTGGFLAAGATVSESEVEKDETHASPASGALRATWVRIVIRSSQRDDRSPRFTDISGRRFSRAPPRS